MKIFGYCRISTIKQNIERQKRNLSEAYPQIILLEEKFTGTTTDRPKYNFLKQIVNPGDKIVFDSISRMSRNSDEGYNDYMSFWENGIWLEFLNEPHLNTEFFNSQLKAFEKFDVNIDKTFEPLIEGIKKTMANIIKGQIKIGFDQAEKEVKDLQERTKQGLMTAKLKGKTIGRPKKISDDIIQDIKENYINSRKKSVKDFLMEYKISKATFYNWLKEVEE